MKAAKFVLDTLLYAMAMTRRWSWVTCSVSTPSACGAGDGDEH